MTDIDRLLAIIGAETPIAAFSLADTWRAEKQGYMEHVADLQAEIQTRAMKDAEDMHRLQAHCAGLYEQLAMAHEIVEALVGAVQYEQAASDTYEATRYTEGWSIAGDALEQAGIATARCLSAARAWLRREAL